jgi:rfaE bifunctional protein nucleotidyltransferase chain/domain
MNKKVLNNDSLNIVCKELKTNDKKVILCHGCFDLLHIGHINYLRKAKSLGDILIVTVTADEYVNKGPEHPIFNENQRAEHLSELSIIDYVSINYSLDATKIIKTIRPDYYVKGIEYKNLDDDITGNIKKEKQTVEKYGGKIFFTDEETYSSSNLLNSHFDIFPSGAKSFLENFRKKYSTQEIIKTIESLTTLNVLVVGDAIIDEYHYTRPLGQTGKGNIFSVQYKKEERFAGGSLAVANHIAGYVNTVTLLTGIGNNKEDEKFIVKKLKKNIKPKFLHFNSGPTILKKRYVDQETDATKLFEVYYYNEYSCDKQLEEQACSWLNSNIKKYDVVVVPDFGNGFIVGKMIDVLTNNAKFLAVNTQINSGNRGYNVITKYKKVDFISLNDPELRLAAHDKNSEIPVIAKKIASLLNSKYLAVTLGTQGAIMLTSGHKSKLLEVPALSTKVVDRVGAGDTFLSLASICLAKNIKPDLALFVANCAAALGVQIVCNRESVDPISLTKYISTLLK